LKTKADFEFHNLNETQKNKAAAEDVSKSKQFISSKKKNKALAK